MCNKNGKQLGYVKMLLAHFLHKVASKFLRISWIILGIIFSEWYKNLIF